MHHLQQCDVLVPFRLGSSVVDNGCNRSDGNTNYRTRSHHGGGKTTIGGLSVGLRSEGSAFAALAAAFASAFAVALAGFGVCFAALASKSDIDYFVCDRARARARARDVIRNGGHNLGRARLLFAFWWHSSGGVVVP
jgi:hypothetical protein